MGWGERKGCTGHCRRPWQGTNPAQAQGKARHHAPVEIPGAPLACLGCTPSSVTCELCHLPLLLGSLGCNVENSRHLVPAWDSPRALCAGYIGFVVVHLLLAPALCLFTPPADAE